MYTLSGARLNITSQPTPSPVLLTTQFVSLAFYVSCGRKFSILKNSSLYFFHSAPLFFRIDKTSKCVVSTDDDGGSREEENLI